MFCRLLVPLLPLVLHALHSVRRAVARVLALTLFGNAAQKWRGFSSAAAATAADAAAAAGLDPTAWWQQQQQQEQEEGQESQQQQQQYKAVLLPGGVTGVLLPEPFLRQYKFPFRVLPVPVAPVAADAAAADAHAHSQQQQAWVKQLVEQQQLLQLAHNNSAVARGMLADCLPPAAHHISQRVLSATANQLYNVDVAAVAQRLLAAVAAASSHAECEQALRQLEQLGSSTHGLLAIAAAGASSNTAQVAAAGAAAEGHAGDGYANGADSSVTGSNVGLGWQAAFERLLGAAPITADDQLLWLRLLQLLERMIAAAPLTQVSPTAESAPTQQQAEVLSNTAAIARRAQEQHATPACVGLWSGVMHQLHVELALLVD